VQERTEPLLAIARRSFVQSDEQAQAVEFILMRLAGHHAQSLLEAIVHQWRLFIEKDRTPFLGVPGQMSLEFEPVVVIPRGPPMRVPPGGSRPPSGQTQRSEGLASGAFQFLELMLDSHKVDRLLGVVLVSWRRHVTTGSRQAVAQAEEQLRSSRYKVLSALMGHQNQHQGLEVRMMFCVWRQVMEESLRSASQIVDILGDKSAQRLKHLRSVGGALAQ